MMMIKDINTESYVETKITEIFNTHLVSTFFIHLRSISTQGVEKFQGPDGLCPNLLRLFSKSIEGPATIVFHRSLKVEGKTETGQLNINSQNKIEKSAKYLSFYQSNQQLCRVMEIFQKK